MWLRALDQLSPILCSKVCPRFDDGEERLDSCHAGNEYFLSMLKAAAENWDIHVRLKRSVALNPVIAQVSKASIGACDKR